MNEIDLGQALQILANVGVIAGIVFLAIELRQNNALMKVEAVQALINHRVSHLSLIAGDHELASIFAKAGEGNCLKPAEKISLDYFYWIAMLNWEWEFLRYEEGLVSTQELPIAGWRIAYSIWPLFPEFLEQAKSALNPDFAKYLDENVVGSR